jgi:polyhydroxyalkanoate synthesis regulator phasin
VAELSDFIKKSLLLSVGAIAFTAEKAQELVDELVEKGDITREQGLSMMKDVVNKGNDARKELRRNIKAEVKKVLEEADIPSRTDVRNIEAKLDRLLLMQGQQAPPDEGAADEPAEAV